MSEGRFWRCSWGSKHGKYRVWVVPRPRLTAQGTSWQIALDNLCARIGDATGDGEPNLSFDPPEPVTGGDAAFAHPKWLMLGAEGSVQLLPPTPDLFTGGLCSHCGGSVGKRTRKPLRACGPGEGDLCWPWYIGVGVETEFNPLMCSERFVAALSDVERRYFRWQPVVLAHRCRTKYFECIPRRIVAPVAVRGWTTDGSICPKCKTRTICCTSESKLDLGSSQIHEWVADKDLPRTPRGMIAVGNVHSWLPIMPTERARSLARVLKGARTAPIGLAPANLIDREPDLDFVPHIKEMVGALKAPTRKTSRRV